MRDLVCLINPRSGGRRGPWLRRELELRLGPDRVRLLDGTDLPALARRAGQAGEGLVACGGDGTASACLSAVWTAEDRPQAPVGVIPLGTGNDLARACGWGHACPDAAGLDHLLHRLRSAATAPIDRWRLEGAGTSIVFYNYCSFGADARITGRFHRLREALPWLFRLPPVNKAIYGLVSLGQHQTCLAGDLRCSEVAVPSWARALVLASIASYAGGARLGEGILPSDGLLDGFAFGPGAALGIAAGGLRRPRRLAALPVLHFSLQRRCLVQVDGEPVCLPVGTYRIAREGMGRILVAR